jgi:protein-S-isoprenylcysteine O-methyltransferase Ste14
MPEQEDDPRGISLSPAEDRPSRIPWPPVIYVATLVVAWLLERWAPLFALPGGSVIRAIGWLVLAAGIGLGLAGLLHFRAIGTTFDPTGAASRMADGGIYAYTRNPMYLGAIVVFVGLSLGLGSVWLLILTVAVLLLLIKLAIEPEEAYLSRRFGAGYAAYRSRVRRWL